MVYENTRQETVIIQLTRIAYPGVIPYMLHQFQLTLYLFIINGVYFIDFQHIVCVSFFRTSVFIFLQRFLSCH